MSFVRRIAELFAVVVCSLALTLPAASEVIKIDFNGILSGGTTKQNVFGAADSGTTVDLNWVDGVDSGYDLIIPAGLTDSGADGWDGPHASHTRSVRGARNGPELQRAPAIDRGRDLEDARPRQIVGRGLVQRVEARLVQPRVELAHELVQAFARLHE